MVLNNHHFTSTSFYHKIYLEIQASLVTLALGNQIGNIKFFLQNMQVKKMMQELKWKPNYFWTYAYCYK